MLLVFVRKTLDALLYILRQTHDRSIGREVILRPWHLDWWKCTHEKLGAVFFPPEDVPAIAIGWRLLILIPFLFCGVGMHDSLLPTVEQVRYYLVFPLSFRVILC